MAIFQDLHAEGKTIILVTHEEDIARHAQRIIHFKDGVIVYDQPVSEPLDARVQLGQSPGGGGTMSLWESISIALEGLIANKMRSMLTMLGVIIGVAAVITMLALASGASSQMMTRIQGMGTNVLMVFQRGGREGGRRIPLSMKDVAAIEKYCPSVLTVAPQTRSTATVKYRNQSSSTSITGTTHEILDVNNYTVQEGKFFTVSDVKGLRKVAVIGPTTAENLFGNASPIGKKIAVNGIRFTVIGEMEAKGGGGFGNPDDQIFIPITTAMRRVSGTEDIGTISVQARDMKLMDQANIEIEATLRKTHRLSAGTENDFNIGNQADIIKMASQASGIFTLLLAGIASVSLLVGGIGIMNIMLVSVTERTREIGIRMALGARRRDIQVQFLVEALVLSLLGGAFGILLGAGLSSIVARISQWNVSVSLPSVLLSFGFAAVVGVFFGYYPARKASQMDPIEALRYE